MDWLEIIWLTLACIGGFKILIVFLSYLYWILFQNINLNSFLYGYVVITGATDGIGKSFAKEFLRRGHKVILISRTHKKLEIVRRELIGLYPQATIEIIEADFSFSHRDPVKFYNSLMEKLSKFEISILVNNVGKGSVKLLLNDTYENLESIIGVNIYPAVMLTHKLLPMFLKRHEETKQKSLVINLSSIMEESVFPGNATYAATKRYMNFFNEGLRFEYSGKVEFASLKPGAVITNMVLQNGTQDVPLSTDPDTYAKAALSGLREGENHGYWKHKILGYIMTFPPYLITVFLVRLILPGAIRRGLVS